jgi:uncharacterized RDD family membrane protein YckC
MTFTTGWVKQRHPARLLPFFSGVQPMSFDSNPYLPTAQDYVRDVGESLPLADRGTRLVAAIVDGLIMMVVAGPVIFGLGFLIGSVMGTGVVGSLVSQIVGGVSAIGIFLAINGYFLNLNGQTVGKKITNIKIVNDDGTKPEFTHLIIYRYGVTWLIGLIPFIGGLYGLVNVLAIFRESRKCLHDDIAKTKVVKA